MKYAIVLAPDAAEDLARLPVQVAILLEGELERLAEKPTQLSRPPRFPYPLRGQMFECEIEFFGDRYFCHVLFEYGQDEQSLHVFAIGVQTI